MEVVSGAGEIYAGDRLLRRTGYRLEVSSDAANRSAAATVIGGSIDITGMAEALVLAGAEELTLRLEDGRSVPFTLGSTAGRIQVRGGLPASPGRQSSR
jgi:hypothetical protein